MSSAQAALDRLCSPDHEVSAHYLMGQDGQIWQLVDEAARAWHAGSGTWQGAGDINSRSIGVELCNDGATPFPNPQITALEWLLQGIQQRWSIPASGVIGHSDMAPGRKIDPGPRFDWARLARQGLAVAPAIGPDTPDAAIDPVTFAADLAHIGYDSSHPDSHTAFRHRTRPWVSGPLDPRDMALARAWAQAVDASRANA